MDNILVVSKLKVGCDKKRMILDNILKNICFTFFIASNLLL